MTIIGLSGAIGSGKSCKQLDVALEHCERKHKPLVCNFPVNRRELYKYCKMKGYHYCQVMVSKDLVSTICNPKKLEALLIPNSVVCLDEAGVWLNSREFARTSKDLLYGLALSRHYGVDLIWCSQFLEQVDKQVRLLTQYWVHCAGITRYNKRARRPDLFIKHYYYLKAADYQQWLSNPKDRASHIKLRFAYSFKYEGGFLNKADRQLFKVYDSLSRMEEESGDRIRTAERCILPNLYFHQLLLERSSSPGLDSPGLDTSSHRTYLERVFSK